MSRTVRMALWMKLLAVTACVLTFAACGGSPESTKYHQTWSKPYSQTTCSDWFDQMDFHEEWVMAGDYLLTWQRKAKPAAQIPDDDTITAFLTAMTSICNDAEDAGNDQLMDGVAQEAYVRGNWPPS